MTKVTTKGQVTIPKPLRDKMGIRPGDEVEFEETPEGLLLRKEVPEDGFERWRGAGTRSWREVHNEIRGRR